MNREDIHIITRYSNWSAKSVENALKGNIYSDSQSWKKFLQYLFIGLGIGFTVSGILFFFAYNWAELHKFAKIGLIEGLIVLIIVAILIPKINPIIKNITLTGASVLVGVLFAVFGQIYQTGANAYDLFLAWTLAITLWVIVANFPPLWLVYLFLINTTIILYSEQVAQNWNFIILSTNLFLLNSLVSIFLLLMNKIKPNYKIPSWLIYIIALAAIYFSTAGIFTIIFDNHRSSYLILIISSFIIYTFGLINGIKSKKTFYISIIPFSLIIIISAILIKVSNGAGMFFVVSMFIIISITILIKLLINLQRKWTNG